MVRTFIETGFVAILPLIHEANYVLGNVCLFFPNSVSNHVNVPQFLWSYSTPILLGWSNQQEQMDLVHACGRLERMYRCLQQLWSQIIQ